MDTPENPPTEPRSASKIQDLWLNWRLFAAGFIGWFLIEGLFWLLIKPDTEDEIIIGNMLLCPTTLIAMIFLAVNKHTRQVPLGVLAAIAVNLVISLIKGLAINGFCFIPFYVK